MKLYPSREMAIDYAKVLRDAIDRGYNFDYIDGEEIRVQLTSEQIERYRERLATVEREIQEYDEVTP